jgi:hypothetical protein
MTDPDRLAEIKMRRTDITEAPWKVGPRSTHVQGVAHVEQEAEPEHDWQPTTIAYCHMTRGHVQSEWRNAKFIASAPADVDWLVGEVDRLRDLLGRLEWAGEGDFGAHCPVCEAFKDEVDGVGGSGHAPGCWLAAELTPERKSAPPSEDRGAS